MFYIIIIAVFLFNIVQANESCGQSVLAQEYIVGGHETKLHKYSWMARIPLIYQDVKDKTKITEYSCGASLVNDQWLVTAAHCFDPEEGLSLKSMSVKLGAHQFSKKEPGHFDATFHKYVVHPSYSNRTMKNDIALLKLDQKLDLQGKHHYLKPICLPNSEQIVKYNDCLIIGWGRTSTDGKYSEVLREAKVPLISSSECRKIHFDDINDNQICAGYKNVSPCSGDSGGPLQCPQENGAWTLEGITSYHVGDCGSGKPEVFTKVLSYVKWINTVIKNN